MSAEFLSQWPLVMMWLAYFVLHSLLAGFKVKALAVARWPVASLRYRLAYNLVALVLLLPIGAWLIVRPGPVLWAWTGGAAWIANGLAALAVVGVLGSAKHYDMNSFFGLRRQSPTAVGAGRLSLSPWHLHVRHPWYSFGLVIIWTRDMNVATLVSVSLITAYVIVGLRLEEQKLVAEFGDAYRRYREQVPALLPWPGKTLSADQARRLVGKP